MEPEDLPWPGELEEDEEEEEEAEEAENLEEDEVVMVEEVEEEEGRRLDADFNFESQRRESTDDEDDEEAKAWLQAHPGGSLPPPSLPRHRYSEGELTRPEQVVPLTRHVWQQPLYQDNSRTQISDTNMGSLKKTAQWGSGDDQRTESWHLLPQETDSSHTLDTTQTRFSVREEGTEVTDFPSLEEGTLTQSENQVKEHDRDLLCSPLLVIQDSFASPDLPLLTCLTKDPEFGPDSLFHQSELDFAPLREIPGKPEDTEWFSRPSEVSEALFQAASDVASDLGNSCFRVSQRPLTRSTAVGSQHSFLPPEQGTKEEIVSSNTLDELKTPKDSDSYDAFCSYMSWKTQEVIQEPETNLADKDQVSFSTASDTSDEYIIPKGSDSFNASGLYVQYWKQEALQQSEKHLTSKDYGSYSDSSDTIDQNKTPKGSDNLSDPFSCMPWSKQGASHHPEICVMSKDHVSFPHEVAPHFNNKVSHSFFPCLLERGGKGVPLMPDNHNFQSVYLRAPTENEVKQKMDSLEGYERNEEDLGKELSQCFELKETGNTLVFSEVHPRSSEIQYIENVVVPDRSEERILSRGHDTSKMEVSGGPLQTVKSNLDKTSEQLNFQEERNQEAPSAFGGKNADASESVAFQAVIASIEPFEKVSSVNDVQTDVERFLTNDSLESEPDSSDLSLLDYAENSFFDKLNHPRYQSTPGVFEPAASKSLLYKKDDGDSSLYWHPNLKSFLNAPQEIVIKPLSLIPECKSSSLSEKSHGQAFGHGKTQSALFQYDTDNEPFLPIGKIKSASALDLAETLGSSDIIYPMKVWTSDSLGLQDLKQQTFEEVADSSSCILGKNVNSSNITESPSAAVGSSFSANLAVCDAQSQGALAAISDASSLIAVGQETLLKADVGQGEIPQPVGAKSVFTIHTIMQNDSYFVEGLQGKAESDIYILDDDTECCSLDENAVECSERVAGLQREICDQGDLRGECIELAGLETLLDDLEICDSSLHWQSTVQLPSKEESESEEPVDHSNVDINQSFSSVSPPFVPHKPTRELEYHSSDLRMLRVSPDTVPRTLKHLTGDTSKGGIAEIPQPNLKPGITTTPEDSDIGSHLSLSPEDFPRLAVRSPQVKTIGQYTDILNQQALADGHLIEETLKVSAVPELADQKTGIASLPFSSSSQRGKPSIFYPQALTDNHLTAEALKVSTVPGLGDQKTGIPTVPPSSYSLGEKYSIFYPQALPGSHQTEEALKGSVVPGEKPGIFYQPALPGSHPSEEALKVSASPRPADQKTGIPATSPTSYLHGEKPSIFYQKTLPESHLTKQALKVSAAPGSPEQKTGIPTVTSTSYPYREKPSILYQQELPDSHPIQQVKQDSAASGPLEQKTGTSTVPSTSYSYREKPSILYQQELPDSHLIEQAQKVSAAPVFAEQKPGTSTVPSTSYAYREKPSILYQQELPDSHPIQQVKQDSAAPGPLEQKTGTSTVPSTSYAYREKPSILYQQELPDNHAIQQVKQDSAAPGPLEQKTETSTVPSTSYAYREKPSILYQQELPDSHPIQQVQQASAAAGPPEQKTGIPTVTSTSYSHREKPSILYQQELPDSHPIQQVKQDSTAPGPLEQKTGTSTVPSTSYAYREKPSILYHQELPDSHPIQQVQQASAASGPPEQKTGTSTVPSTSYAYREKPSILYQQELPDSHPIQQVKQASAAPGPLEQKTGTSTVPSTSYAYREKPSILYHRELPDSHPIQQVQQASAAPGPPEQKTGTSTVPSTSYAYREKPSILYQQELPDSHPIQQVKQDSTAPGPLEQKTGTSTVPSTSYAYREKPSILYHRELPDSHPIQQVQQASAAPGPPEQKTGTSTVPSTSYAYREKPSILYQQELPDSHPIQQVKQASAAPGPPEQKTGTSTVPSTSYAYREKPSILYQQELPDSHPIQQVQQASAAPGPPEQKTGIPTVTSTSYSHREKPSILYQQELPDSHLIEQVQKVSAAPVFAEHKTGTSTVPSTSYAYREKPSILYQQELPDSHPIQQVKQDSTAPGPPEQKTGIPTVTSTSYAYRGKPSILYQQELPDSHLIEQVQKVSAAPVFAEQKTGISTVPSTSYSHREKPSILYQQELPDSHLTKEAQRVPGTPGLGHQKTGVPIAPPAFFSHRGKTSFSYQQELPDSHLKDQTQKISAILGPVDPDTGLQTVPSSSYAHREKPIIFYQQKLPDSHLTEEALKDSAVAGPADQKTGTSESSRSYSHREKSSIFYQQELPDSHPTEEALKVSGISETGDQKTGIPTVTSTSYSHKEKPIIFYHQALPDSQLTVEALKVSGVPGPADQKTGMSTIPSSSSSYREKPIISYQQEFPDLTQVALKVLEVPGPADQKIGIPAVTSTYSRGEKPIISYEQELPDSNKDALELLGVPGQADQNTGMQTVPPTSYSHRESPVFSYQKELPDITEETLKVSAVPGPSDQKTGIRTSPSSSYSYREKPDGFYQQELPNLTEEALKVFALPGPADQNTEIPTGPSSSFSHKEKLKISTVILPDDQKTELPLAPTSSYSHREKPKTSAVIGLDSKKTPLLTVFCNSYSQRVKPSIFFRQQLPDRHQSEDILKISPVPEPTDVNPGIAIPLSSSYSHREKSDIFYPQELPDQHQTEDTLKVSTVPGPADQKIVLPSVPPSSFSHREKPVIFYQQDLPERHLTEDDPKSSSSLGQADQITGLLTVPPDSYSYSEKHKLVSDHVQRLIDNLESSNSSVISSNMPLNSQADSRIVINKPESSGFEDAGTEEIRGMDNGSKTLKEIRTLLMEAENIALRRYNFPVPLVPFRDVSDISFIQSKKVVCFKEPPTTDESNGDLSHRQPFTEESPNNKCMQKDISTQTNLKCQRGIENWEFISSTAVRSPVQEAEGKARVTLDETLRQYKAAKSVMRSEPEGYSGTIGNKIVIPMMTIIKSDSSSDASSCSWDSNSLESVSDVLNFLPRASPKTSVTDSREEEGVLESDDGGGSSVDSLAAHVKNLLKCESSLNHAKQILRNAEEEESRVRARAWNLKFNMAHDCGYSISELNEDDRRKVEEIKAKLFGHGRTTDLSKGLQSPRGIGCKSEAVCSHIIIESHEKGCFRTLTAEQPQLDSHPYVFRPAESSEMIRRRQWSPSSWRTRHINLSKSSVDQSNSHFRVWNSSQLQSHSPFQHFTANDLKISEGLRMPFRENLDPWLSELVEPTCMPPEEMDYHSSPQALPPEPMKKFTTSITFSSHRHSNCFSDSSFLKVGVTEGSQCTGGSVGVFNSHFTEEQNPPRDLKQKTSSPSSCKIISQSPGKAVTILTESSRQSQKLSVEHSHQEVKLLERSDFKDSHSKPSSSANGSNFKEVHSSDNPTLVSMSRPSSTLGTKEKNVTITPDLPSHTFLEQQEFFEQSRAPHADHHVRKQSPPPQHQDYIAPKLPCRIFLEKRELSEQRKAPHVDHQVRENHSPLPQRQDYIAPDLPSSIFLEQRQLFEQSKAPDVDPMKKHHAPLAQGQDYVVEKNNQQKPKLHVSDMINVEAKSNNVVSPSVPDQCTVITSTFIPPSNRKALSYVRITLCPKTPSKLDSGTLDKRFHSLDPASKTRMNSEFNSDLQTVSSRSLEPTSKLLTSKPIAQDQESLGFLGPKSSPDFQVVQSPLPDSNIITQDLKTIPFQNSQIVTSRQTQVNISDLEGYSSPEGTPVSADRSSREIKAPVSSFSGKMSSDAVTQITTESPGKAIFSSEIFVNAKDRGHQIPETSTQKLGNVPVRFASSSSVQQITVSHGTNDQPSLLPYKPSGTMKMYYVPQLKEIPSLSLDSKSDTTIESSHSGSNDAIAPDFPAQVLGTRNDDLADTVNIKHKEGIYSKRVVSKAPSSVGKKPFQKDHAAKSLYAKKYGKLSSLSPKLSHVIKPPKLSQLLRDAQVQVLITSDENLSEKNQEKEIYSKRVVTEAVRPEEESSLQKNTTVSSDATVSELSAQLQDMKTGNIPDTKAIEQKEEIQSKRTVPKEAWPKDKESLQIDNAESRRHSEYENTTHSVFKSAKFYFHHPVHLPSDQDFCHESLGRSVFMRHSWKDLFQHHSDKQREHTYLPPPYQNVEKTKTDYTRVESLSINVNLENKEVKHTTKSQARDYPKSDKQVGDPKEDDKASPQLTTQRPVSLNELWNKFQERQRQQKPPASGKKELSLVERLDRLAKLLQHPITYSLQPSESTQDESREEQDVKGWTGRQQQQKHKLQKKKRYKSLEKCHKNTGDLKRSKVLSTHQAERSNQIKIEQIKFDKYILRKQPGFHCNLNNTSSDSRPSEESDLFTDTTTNILSTTTSPVESDILTQTDKELALHERSSSVSTIDTARLIHAFGHERVCLSPRRTKLYSSITDHQRRYLEKHSKKYKKALNTGYPQITSEHTRRKHIQVTDHISSDSVSSSTSSFWNSTSTFCIKQNVHMLNKGVQAGNLEIVNGVRKHTRDVGMTFPTPSSSKTRVEEDSDVTSWSEEKIEEKKLLTNCIGDKKLRKNKQSCCEGVSWFVPVENVKSVPKKENLPMLHGPGVAWFAPITSTKPWREPLREQNWQGQPMDSPSSLAGLGREPPKPFVRVTLQESLHLHRPDFISRSGERIKRLKLIVQERKMQNMLQSERDALFNTGREWQGCRGPVHPLLPKRGFLAAQKKRPIGKKEMIQRSKRIYEQLPEVQKKREEEKRRSEYKSYRLRAQLYKKKVANQLLGRKVPWD